MRKSLMLVAAIIGGIGLATLIAIFLADRYGTFYPLCGSGLRADPKFNIPFRIYFKLLQKAEWE